MTIKSVGLFIATVLPTSAVIAFGFNRLSKDRFDTKVKKFEFINPYYDDLEKMMIRTYKTIKSAKEQLIETISSTETPNPMISEALFDNYLNMKPKNGLIDFEVSGQLPKRCKNLSKELSAAFDNGIDLIFDTANYYGEHTFYVATFTEQVRILGEAQKLMVDKINEIKEFIEEDKSRLTKSVRRRTWYSK